MGRHLFQFVVLMVAMGMGTVAVLCILEGSRRDPVLRWVCLALFALSCLFHLAKWFS